MCVIVDTNEAHEFFQRSPVSIYAPVIRWISTGDGRLRYGGKLKAELMHIRDAARLLRVWSAAGRAVDEGDDRVAAEERRVDALHLCRSNDLHVIALARVSGARVLCTRDVDLIADFHNK